MKAISFYLLLLVSNLNIRNTDSLMVENRFILLFCDSPTKLAEVQLLHDAFEYLNNPIRIETFLVSQNDHEHALTSFNHSMDECCLILSVATSEKWTALIEKLTISMKIPLLRMALSSTFFEALRKSTFPLTDYLQIVPYKRVTLGIFRDLFTNIEPHSVVILYQPQYDYVRTISELLSVQQARVTSFEPFERSPSDIEVQLNRISAKGQVIVFLMANTTFVEHYLQLVLPKYVNHSISWAVITVDSQMYWRMESEETVDVRMLWIKAANVLPVDIIDNFYLWREGEKALTQHYKRFSDSTMAFYYDIAAACTTYISMLSNAKSLWSKEDAKSPGRRVYLSQAFQNRSASAVYGRYVGSTDGRIFQEAVLKLYLIESGESCKHIKLIGNWSPLTGLNLFYDTGLGFPKRNHLRIAYIIQPPFVERYTDANGELKLRGYSIDLIDEVTNILNYTYELYEVNNGGTFGYLNKRRRYNGIIGDISTGDADVSFNGLAATAERELFVDYTFPHFDLSGQSIMVRRKDADSSIFKFLTVMEPPVWLSIIASFFFTSFLLWMFDHWSPYSSRNRRHLRNDERGEKREFTFKESLWFCVNSLTPQGGGEAPECMSGRLLAATWWLFGFIIIASYTANLAAFLTVSRLEIKIDSLQDLARQYKVKYAPVKYSAAEAYFKRMVNIEYRFYDAWQEVGLNTSIPALDRAKMAIWDYPVSEVFTNMWRYMKETGLPNSFDEGLQWVLNSNEKQQFALIGETTVLQYYALSDCRLKIVGEEFNRRPYAIAVQQGSCLKDPISNAILKLLNERKLEILKEKWWSQHPNAKHCPRDEAVPEGLSVSTLGGVFAVIIVGMTFCLLSFIIEFAYFKRRLKKCLPISSSHPNNGCENASINEDRF